MGTGFKLSIWFIFSLLGFILITVPYFVSLEHVKLEEKYGKEKGKRIVQEWITTDWPDQYLPSRLEFTFKEIEGKTEVTMVHSNIPTEQEEELKQGWIDFYWKPLKIYFEKLIFSKK